MTFRGRHPGAASFACAAIRGANRLPEDGRSHAVLRHDAAADAPRHVLDAGVRRESRWRGLEADWIRRPSCLSAAVRLLRPRLSGFRRRSLEEAMSVAQRIQDSETVDFVVVGSGAAGGVIARELAQAGLSVVVLEQGPRLSPADFEHDELKNWFLGGITNDAVRNPQTFRDDPAEEGGAPEVQAGALVRTRGRWREPALHGQLLALPRDRFHRAQRARRDRRHRLRRLADHLRRSRAVLHQGRVGDWRLGSRRRQPVRSAAHQAVSDAAAAGEVVRRAPRARRAQAGPASVSGADGDQLAAVPRPAGVRALRVLPRLRVRGGREGVDADDGDSGSGGDRPLRSAARQLRGAHRDQQAGTRHGRRLLRSRIGASDFRRRGRSSCAPTARRRRGCC